MHSKQVQLKTSKPTIPRRNEQNAQNLDMMDHRSAGDNVNYKLTAASWFQPDYSDDHILSQDWFSPIERIGDNQRRLCLHL